MVLSTRGGNRLVAADGNTLMDVSYVSPVRSFLKGPQAPRRTRRTIDIPYIPHRG
jgi:hypothetical protein